MFQYPSIDGSNKAPLGKPCYAFEKYDGSNLRFEWSPKKQWFKFGTKHRLFDHTDPQFGQAIYLWQPLGEEIQNILCKEYKRLERITAFCEFFGEKSFAGNHVENDPKKLMLFDVHLWKKGILSAKEFIDIFEEQNWSAKLIYTGNLNQQLIKDVKENKYNLAEGVVCKGVNWSCKIKTNAWLERLKTTHPQIYDTENEI